MYDACKLVETKTSSELIYDGEILHIYKDTIKLPNGKSAGRELIRHIGAVGIVPVTEDGKVIMEHQFRYPINEVNLEIPAGKLDSKTEDRLEAAKRELEEETGITADTWVDMGVYVPVAAYSDERITLYLATGLHYGNQNLDEDEFIQTEAIALEELVERVMSGEITDGKTQVAILKADRIIGKK